MNDELAHLMSAATTMDDMIDRITATANRLAADGDDANAADLYEVERALRNANRRLARILAAMR